MDSIHVAQSPAKQSAYLNSFSAKNPDNAEKGAGGTSGDSDTSWLSALDMSCRDQRIFKYSKYNLKSTNYTWIMIIFLQDQALDSA